VIVTLMWFLSSLPLFGNFLVFLPFLGFSFVLVSFVICFFFCVLLSKKPASRLSLSGTAGPPTETQLCPKVSVPSYLQLVQMLDKISFFDRYQYCSSNLTCV
jgi:hypothetical protein